MAASTAAGSPRSASAISGAGRMPARFSRRPVVRLSSTRTRRPCATRVSTRCEPIKPAPPVTRQSSLMGNPLIGEECFDKRVRVEGFQVFQLLADADEFHRQIELLFDGENRPTLGTAIELG